ncbi:MAG: hypothetical protein UHN47_18020 [Lachnospiraceae bacterium]|nr:hypothetical protein [Lachnospiraceae bacterium]
MEVKKVGVQDTIRSVSVSTNLVMERQGNQIKPSVPSDTQGYAAIMEISKEGYEKSLKRVDKGDTSQDENMMSGEVVKTLKELVDTVKCGGALTEEEEKRLHTEMEKEIKIQYQSVVDMRLDKDDERVLKEMKDDYLLKQRTLAEMQERIQQEKLAEEAKEIQKTSTENANQIVNKLSEIEMLNQSLDIDTSAEKSVKKEDTEQTQEEEAQNHPLEKAMVSVEKKEEAVKELENRQILAAKAEKEYGKLLTQEYEKNMQSLSNKEITLQEKVKNYESFIKESAELCVKREIERHRKMFYYEARLEAKNELRANQEIQDTQEMLEEQRKIQQEMMIEGVGQEFVKEKLEESLLRCNER